MEGSDPTRRRDLDEIGREVEDPVVRGVVRVAYHLRRYKPFYVFALVWALMLAVFPSVNPLGESGDGTEFSAAGGAAQFSGDGTGGVAAGASDDVGDLGGTAGTVASGTGSGGGAAAPGSGSRSSGAGAGVAASGGSGGGAGGASLADILGASGPTRGLGVPCNGGDQRQIPWSAYAAPCVARYDGPNGGETAPQGVTAEGILVVFRDFPESANERAVNEVNAQAGFSDPETVDKVRQDFVRWFNQVYELYGRQVVLEKYVSEHGNGTNEAQSKGKEGACLDADKVAKEIKAFASWNDGTGPFGECAAERGVVAFDTGAYFPESWYRRHHPYAYHVLMECERIAHQVAEYIGKRLAGSPAKWARDAVLASQTRRFGTYVPDNDEYQHCVKISRSDLENRWGADPGPQYNYILDFSRFADEAAKGVVQFKAAGVTTIILACDPYSVIFLTQQAEAQRWGPEWLLIGVAATDTDNFGRLYVQEQVDGHMFGMSQLSDITLLIGPKSEAGRSYRAIPRDQRSFDEMPDGTNGDYYDVLHIFNGLQLAGPHLNAQTLFEGYCHRYPPSPGPAGMWAFDRDPDGNPGCDHTAIDDSREVYWDGSATAPDDDAGTFLQTYGGKRFVNGEWPAEEPPIYPGG